MEVGWLAIGPSYMGRFSSGTDSGDSSGSGCCFGGSFLSGLGLRGHHGQGRYSSLHCPRLTWSPFRAVYCSYCSGYELLLPFKRHLATLAAFAFSSVIVFSTLLYVLKLLVQKYREVVTLTHTQQVLPLTIDGSLPCYR